MRGQGVGRIAQQRFVIAGEGHLGNDGDVGGHRARGRDRRFDLLDVRHRLNDQQIDAGRLRAGRANQGGDLLAERRLGFGYGDAAKRGQPHPQRPERPGQQHVAERSIDHAPGNGHGGVVDGLDLVLQAVLGQLETVGAEGVGLNQVRTGVDVAAVDFGHQCGVGQVDGVERLVDRHAATVEDSAKSPIHQDGAFGQTLFEFLAIHRAAIVPD